jgi:heparan-alpha-glucosaminide N-acetyltransferase
MSQSSRPAISGRLASLDTFRAFDILLMIFVNYIAGMKAIPWILRHAAAEMDTYTLTDLVFPGFLYIVGVAIPLSLAKRTQAGSPLGRILSRVAVRTAGLIVLGVIMVNESRYSAADTGLSRALWYLLAYLAVIAIWNVYPKTENRRRRRLYLGLRFGAVLVLIVLVVLFRGRTEAGTVVWLQPSWWGILGQIGWAYLLGSLLYLAFRRSRVALIGSLGLLIAFNSGNHLGVLNFLGAAGTHDMKAMVSCHGAIVLAGIIIGTLFAPSQKKTDLKTKVLFMLLFGIGLYLAGTLLRPIQGISKIRATESYALVSAGLCTLVLLGFYLLLDVLKTRRWSEFLRPVGVNPLLAYILPDILNSALGVLSSLTGYELGRWLWPFAERGGVAGMLNALAVTGIILMITGFATRWKIILKV